MGEINKGGTTVHPVLFFKLKNVMGFFYGKKMATIDHFLELDIRVGKIVKVEDFPEARKPSYKWTIDFGEEIGVKHSSAQLVDLYTKEELQDKLVLGVVNLPARQIGPFISESLTLGVPDAEHKCILIRPDKDAPVGGKLY